MTEDNSKKNIYNANDTLDINELASLNDDISPEFIEQLQNKIAQDASEFTGKPILSDNDTDISTDDSELFEESQPEKENPTSEKKENNENKLNLDIDDNFIKKYKAKLNKQGITPQEETSNVSKSSDDTKNEDEIENLETPSLAQLHLSNKDENTDINKLTKGNIVERPIKTSELEYNENLDTLDNNVKYDKYVIYIEPENKDFIESLTVKERKNLINRILREQDDIALTKKRYKLALTVMKHIIVAIITLSLSIPAVLWLVNNSLEASINNYRQSKTIFKDLYKEKGKIQKYTH